MSASIIKCFPCINFFSFTNQTKRFDQYSLLSVLFLGIVWSFATPLLAQDKEDSVNRYLNRRVVFVGISGGASLRESENEDILIQKIPKQSKSGFNVLITGGYMFSPTFAVGGGFRYDQSRVSKKVEDTDGIISEIEQAGTIITSSAYVKNYIPLTSNGRINLYNIAGFGWVKDQLLTENFSEDVLTRTYSNTNSLQLGLSPGIQVFVIDGFATEVGVNVAGLSMSKKVVEINGVEESTVSTFDVDFKLNILSLNISFYYYIPL